jgi:hypothetical protein
MSYAQIKAEMDAADPNGEALAALNDAVELEKQSAGDALLPSFEGAAVQLSHEFSAEIGVGFARGHRVNWLRTEKRGYGFTTPVAAVVEAVGAKKVKIRAARRTPGGEWEHVTVWVARVNLRPREKQVPEVDLER